MRVLILHNDNLPRAILAAGRCAEAEFTVSSPFRPESENAVENYDSFADARLAEIFGGQEPFDAVVLPYSFSLYNCLEYTGLRVAMHIRLTPAWGHEHVPMLFLGPDSKEEVGKLSDMGALLFTTNVHTSDAVTPEGLLAELRRIVAIYRSFSEDDRREWYARFLDKVPVEPPANYGAPHSASNEWAVMRWIEMFNWSSGKAPEVDNSVFMGMLYFKSLMVSSGRRTSFRRKNRKSPCIAGIRDKTFVLIDDCADRGWERLLRELIEAESGGVLHCFDGFDCAEDDVPDTGELEREELLAEIDDFLRRPEIAAADCYIVDLNLCQADTDCPPENLTGLEVVRRLRAMNRANQVVIFTASDQVWNLKDVFSVMGVAGYAVKEDPEDNLSRSESYRLFCEFGDALRKAAKLSSLKRYADYIDAYEPLLGDDADLLDDIVDLLLVDRPEFTLKAAVLNLVIFLENYLKGRYNVCDDGNLYSRPEGRFIARFEDRICFRREMDGGHSNVVDVKFLRKGDGLPSGWAKAKDSSIRDMIVPLCFRYGFSEADCRSVVLLKKLRNTRIAHGGGGLPMKAEDLMSLCDRVLFPMLKKDYEDEAK